MDIEKDSKEAAPSTENAVVKEENQVHTLLLGKA